MDIKKINDTARSLKKVEERKEEEEARARDERVRQLIKNGQQVRAACKQFYDWATKNKIPTTSWPAKHSWSLRIEGLGLARYVSGMIRNASDIKIYTLLIVGAGRKFVLYSFTEGYDSWVDDPDDNLLGNFTISAIEKKTIEVSIQTGVPFS